MARTRSDPLGQRRQVRLGRDIGPVASHDAITDRGTGIGQPLLVDIDERQPHSLAREQFGELAADPAGGAEDDGQVSVFCSIVTPGEGTNGRAR
jgi:hypothetical protein